MAFLKKIILAAAAVTCLVAPARAVIGSDVQPIVSSGGVVFGSKVKTLTTDTTNFSYNQNMATLRINNINIFGSCTGSGCGSGGGGSGIVSPGTFTWLNNFGMSFSTITVTSTSTLNYVIASTITASSGTFSTQLTLPYITTFQVPFINTGGALGGDTAMFWNNAGKTLNLLQTGGSSGNNLVTGKTGGPQFIFNYLDSGPSSFPYLTTGANQMGFSVAGSGSALELTITNSGGNFADSFAVDGHGLIGDGHINQNPNTFDVANTFGGGGSSFGYPFASMPTVPISSIDVRYNVKGGSLTATNMAGTGVRCVHVDNSGNMTVSNADCGTGSGNGSPIAITTGTATTYSNPAVSSPMVVGVLLQTQFGITASGTTAYWNINPAMAIVATSTGAITTRLIQVGVDTATLKTRVDNLDTSTNTLAQNFPVSLSTNTMSSIDLSGTKASGILAAARFPALTGDVTTSAGALATTAAAAQTHITSISPAGTLTLGSQGNAVQIASNTILGPTTFYANVAPSLIAGTNITSITGTWPNQTINAATQAGGGGGASTLGMFKDGVQVTSPTPQINVNGNDLTLTANGTTAYLALNPNTTNFIHNQTTLQANATMDIASGTFKTITVTNYVATASTAIIVVSSGTGNGVSIQCLGTAGGGLSNYGGGCFNMSFPNSFTMPSDGFVIDYSSAVDNQLGVRPIHLILGSNFNDPGILIEKLGVQSNPGIQIRAASQAGIEFVDTTLSSNLTVPAGKYKFVTCGGSDCMTWGGRSPQNDQFIHGLDFFREGSADSWTSNSANFVFKSTATVGWSDYAGAHGWFLRANPTMSVTTITTLPAGAGLANQAWVADGSNNLNYQTVLLSQNSLQAGATIYVASGTIQNLTVTNLTVGGTGDGGWQFNIGTSSYGVLSSSTQITVGHLLCSGSTNYTAIDCGLPGTGGGGGSGAPIAFTTGTATTYSNPAISSPMLVGTFLNTQFAMTASGTTMYLNINPAMATVATSTASLQTQINTLNSFFPVKIGSGTIGPFDVSATSASANGAAGLYARYNLTASTITTTAMIVQTTSVTVLGAGGLTVNSLTASLPVQTDANLKLISAAIDLSGSQATGVLAAAREPAHTGDVTNSASSLAMTAAATQGNIKTFTSAITFVSSVTVQSSLGIYAPFGMNVGTMTGAGLTTCGDASHALAYSATTGLFSCQSITGSAAAGGTNGNVQINTGGAIAGATGFDVWTSSIVSGPTRDVFVSTLAVTSGSMTIQNAGSMNFTRATFNIDIATDIITTDQGNAFNFYQSSGFVMGADSSTVNASLTTLPGMGFAIGANETWEMRCTLFIGSSTAGMQFGVNGPSGATVKAALLANSTPSTAFTSFYITALNTASSAVATGGATNQALINGKIDSSSTAGAVVLQFRAATAAQANAVFAGSFCGFQRIK